MMEERIKEESNQTNAALLLHFNRNGVDKNLLATIIDFLAKEGFNRDLDDNKQTEYQITIFRRVYLFVKEWAEKKGINTKINGSGLDILFSLSQMYIFLATYHFLKLKCSVEEQVFLLSNKLSKDNLSKTTDRYLKSEHISYFVKHQLLVKVGAKGEINNKELYFLGLKIVKEGKEEFDSRARHLEESIKENELFKDIIHTSLALLIRFVKRRKLLDKGTLHKMEEYLINEGFEEFVRIRRYCPNDINGYNSNILMKEMKLSKAISSNFIEPWSRKEEVPYLTALTGPYINLIACKIFSYKESAEEQAYHLMKKLDKEINNIQDLYGVPAYYFTVQLLKHYKNNFKPKDKKKYEVGKLICKHMEDDYKKFIKKNPKFLMPKSKEFAFVIDY